MGGHPTSPIVFFGITFFKRISHVANSGVRFACPMRTHRQRGLAIRSRVLTHPRIRGLCHWAGEPAGRHGAESPSRRAAEHASERKSSSPRLHRPQGLSQTHPAHAVFRHRRVRLLWSPAHSRAWPFVVAKATQVCRRNRNQPGSGLRATALARSDHPTAAGESAPSVTLPPTSPPAIVRCGDTPVFQSPGDRREQHKRKPRLIFTSASQAAKIALKERHTVRPRPEECAGVARPRQSPSAIATIRHDLTLHRALRRMAGLVFLLVFRVLAGACQRHGVGGFLV